MLLRRVVARAGAFFARAVFAFGPEPAADFFALLVLRSAATVLSVARVPLSGSEEELSRSAAQPAKPGKPYVVARALVTVTTPWNAGTVSEPARRIVNPRWTSSTKTRNRSTSGSDARTADSAPESPIAEMR